MENSIKSFSGEYLLEMKDICKSFPGVKALDNAQLKVRPGTVHALMGENGAGKSTLMKCLFGIYVEDVGEIKIEGEKIRFINTRQALDSGVSMVHQELNQVLKMTVMDNIWIGRYPCEYLNIKVNRKKMYTDTKKIFEELNIDIDPNIKMEKLSVSQRQMAEIAKAVSYNAKILVFDEPTSSLTENEVKHLFTIINYLKKRNCGIIYISHKMEEILVISDEVTVMRDGKWVATNPVKGLTIDKIVKLMVGRDLTERFPPRDNIPGKVMLEIKNLTGTYQPNVVDVNFTVREGEVFGIAGLVGSKRTEVLENIFGMAKHKEGEIILKDKKILNKTPRDSISNKFAFLTEERRATGIFPGLSIKFNAIIANLDAYGKVVVNDKKATTDTKWVIDSMNVKTPSNKTAIGTLSGGNQQKVIIGRWLLTDADVYLLDEPTRGIDVGAKYEIYQLIFDIAKRGKIVIIVSSEMPELIGITNRIMVMSNGRVAGIVETKDTNQEEILMLAAKYI